MSRGFVTLDRDAITVSKSPLTFSSKRTLLFMFLVMHANHTGDTRGCININYNHLACVIGETYHTTRRWVKKLCKDNVITMQKQCKDHVAVSICNYDDYQGVQRDSVNTVQSLCKDSVKMCPDSLVISEGYKPLISNNKEVIKESLRKEKEKEKINKKEKENAAAEAAAATAKKNKNRQTSIQDVESTLDTDFVAFAESIGFNPEYIHVEYDKWMDWQDSKGKRFTDNKMAFKNWLRNAVKFHGQHTTPSFSVDDIRRLN